ncbi:hypothetical protein AB0J82_28920 [Asanoa sp. NPDC049518]|uniref:hypothetical protein n=1 Tax=unclassified Asanoa TaxID=2685164 RepID=UPI00342ED7CC
MRVDPPLLERDGGGEIRAAMSVCHPAAAMERELIVMPAAGHTSGVRRCLGDGWSIELAGVWTPERTHDGVTMWRAAGRTMRVSPGDPWRCADGADIVASIEAELPPNPVGKVGEGGQDGVGHRAAWLYCLGGDVEFNLCGYNFADGAFLETVFIGADTADPGWAFAAWRSVTRSEEPSGSLPAG